MKRNIEGIDVHHLFASVRVNKIMGDGRKTKKHAGMRKRGKLQNLVHSS